MFSVGVSDQCRVAHSFADPFFGLAQRLHGASYVVDVEVHSNALGAHHAVLDLAALRAIVRRAIETVDYSNLDDNPAFPGRTSTIERLAQYLADLIADAIGELPEHAQPIEPAALRLRLRESPTAWAGYERPLP
jgi:6-pyruvoyl-tetrahydropterin synthase